VGATERLVLFPTWLLLDLLGVVMLSTFGYEHFVLQVIVCAHTYCAVVNLNQIFFSKHTVIAHTAGINLNHIFLFVITHNLKKKNSASHLLKYKKFSVGVEEQNKLFFFSLDAVITHTVFKGISK